MLISGTTKSITIQDIKIVAEVPDCDNCVGPSQFEAGEAAAPVSNVGTGSSAHERGTPVPDSSAQPPTTFDRRTVPVPSPV